MITWDRVDELVTHARVTGSGYSRVNCPACWERHGSPDHKASLSANRETGWWKCHRCDWRGRLAGFHDDPADRLALVPDDPPVIEVEEPSDYWPLGPESRWVLRRATAYLDTRGIPESTWTAARLGYARTGRHQGRIILPMEDADDWRTLGFAARTIRGDVPKYLTALGLDRSWSLYNGDQLTSGSLDPILGVEGPISALRHWPRAVAYLGKPTTGQLARLARASRASGRPIVQVLDGDAWRAGLASAQTLRAAGVACWALALPAGQDPDTHDPVELWDAALYAAREGTDVDLG